MAFVNGDERHWWESGLHGGRYKWPAHIKQQDTLDSWTELFVANGFVVTDNRDHEPRVEKIAIYLSLDDMTPSHVARSDGVTWKSKLGKGQDIEHATLDVLEGDQQSEYGIVEVVLKKPIKTLRGRKNAKKVK